MRKIEILVSDRLWNFLEKFADFSGKKIQHMLQESVNRAIEAELDKLEGSFGVTMQDLIEKYELQEDVNGRGSRFFEEQGDE